MNPEPYIITLKNVKINSIISLELILTIKPNNMSDNISDGFCPIVLITNTISVNSNCNEHSVYLFQNTGT